MEDKTRAVPRADLFLYKERNEGVVAMTDRGFDGRLETSGRSA